VLRIFVMGGRQAGTLPLFLLLCLGLSWAIRLLAIKAASEHGASPIEVAAVATTGIVVLLTLINLGRSRLPPIEVRHLRFYTLAGLFGFGAPFLLEITVAPHLSALLFVIIVTSTPIWTVFIAAISRVEPVNSLRAFGVVLGFAATALVIVGNAGPAATDGLQTQAPWIMAALAIPVLYAVYILYIAAAWPSDLDNLQGAQGQSTIALATLVIPWLAFSERGSRAETIAGGWPVAIVILTEIIGLLLLFHLARRHGGSFTAQANYVAVVAGSLIGLVLFDQQVNATAIGGILMLVVALRLSARYP
jgi:drug/metabolite transporter (DMT)-like permease